ncbi:UDP binding domain-containing protein, partial [Actinomadura kijaniata]
AQEINDRMPRYVVERAQQLLNREGRALKGSRVLLLGVTYKADIADQRESPARPVARRLAKLGAELTFHDPHVDTWRVGDAEVPRSTDLTAALEAADLTIVLADHRDYDPATLTRHARLLFDTRGRTRGRAAETVELL